MHKRKTRYGVCSEKSNNSDGKVRTPGSSASADGGPAQPVKQTKKDFIPNAYHDDVVDEALGHQKKTEGETKSTTTPNADNRLTWGTNLITRRPIRALAKEFAANKKIKPVDFTTEAYEKNDAKNRYNDIVCIDATRVVLKDRPPDNDYIHASWMTMPDSQKYICTQGPLQEYVGDFWHMIVTEKSKVIVMLCNFNEGKHEKCCVYLPKDKKDVCTCGNYVISVKSSKPDPFEGIKHTELEVKWSESKTFTVHHLAYFDWPDHTAPLNPKPTVGAFKLARTLANGNPITVHCSAGIGRSATFVAIDYAAQKIRENPEALMIDVVRDLRAQRYQAIQSAIQYVFLHICLLEYFAEDNILPKDTKFNEYLESYVSMIKRYNKKVEAKQREQSKGEQ